MQDPADSKGDREQAHRASHAIGAKRRSGERERVYRCRICGKVVDDREIEFDHVIPHSKGGPTSVENIRLLCESCNRKPTDNAAIESFNGRFRDECLNVHRFESIEDAKGKIEAWRQDYNADHPHRALKNLSPNEYARK